MNEKSFDYLESSEFKAIKDTFKLLQNPGDISKLISVKMKFI